MLENDRWYFYEIPINRQLNVGNESDERGINITQ